MRELVTFTPSQRAWHEAAKAREADRMRKAMRLNSAAPSPEPIEQPRTKTRFVQVAPEGEIIPLHFATFKSISIMWVGEYCPYAGGSIEVALNRSMTEIAVELLKTFSGITLSDVKGSSRAQRVAFPRQVIMHTIKNERPDLSFPQVGRWMGGRDHTTAMHSVNKIQAMIDKGTFESEMADWQRQYGSNRKGASA